MVLLRASLMLVVCALPAAGEEGVGQRLSAGWHFVLDVPELLHAQSADPATAMVSSASDDQVVLLGLTPGVTVLSVWSGPANAPRRIDYPLTVERNTTVQPWAALVTARVDTPQRLKLPTLQRAEIANSTLCEANLVGSDSLELVPKRPGTTTLLIWLGGTLARHREQILVTVEADGISRAADEVDNALTEPPGRLVLVSGEHAIVDAPPGALFAVRDPTVALFRTNLAGAPVIEGLAVGATRLHIWDGHRPLKPLFIVVHPRSPAEPPVDVPIEPPSARVRQNL